MNQQKISDTVRKTVALEPCILECLREGIVNYSALARRVSEKLGLGAREANAVKMALIRLTRKLEPPRGRETQCLLARSSLEMRTDLAVLHADSRAYPVLHALLREEPETRFSQLSVGSRFLTLVADKTVIEKLAGKLRKNGLLRGMIRDQAAIIIVSPEEVEYSPGFVYGVAGLLAAAGINLTELVSCYSDTILVVDRREAARAYGVLEEALLHARREC